MLPLLKEEKRSRVGAIQMDNLEVCLVLGGWMRVFYSGSGHMEIMEKDRIAKRVYVGVCAGSCSLGRPRKR